LDTKVTPLQPLASLNGTDTPFDATLPHDSVGLNYAHGNPLKQSFVPALSELPLDKDVLSEQTDLLAGTLRLRNNSVSFEPSGEAFITHGDRLTGADPIHPLVGEWEQNLLNFGNETSLSSPTEIVFVDPSIENYQSLIAEAGTNAEVIVLDAQQDGIAQISNVLATRRNVAGVHILAHGESGELQLGSTRLSADTLANYTDALKEWSTALTADADLLVYGCGVSEGTQGQQFIHELSTLTGADVAASDDLTGSFDLGGDWILEDSTGAIETRNLFPEITGWHGLLPILRGDLNVIAGNFTYNEQVSISGKTTLKVFGDLDVSAFASIVGDNDAATQDDLTIEVEGSVIIGGPIGGLGLNSLKIEADKGITVRDGTQITLPGDLTFTTKAGLDLTWQQILLNPLFTEQGTEAKIEIGNNARISAANVAFTADSNTSKFTKYDVFEDGLLGLLEGNQLAETTGDPKIKFEAAVDSKPAKITRLDNRSWETDGFDVGEEIKIIGSAKNDDNTYTIAAIKGNILELAPTDVLQSEDAPEGIVIKQVLTSVLPKDVPIQYFVRDENGKIIPMPTAQLETPTVEQASNILKQQVVQNKILDFNLPVEAIKSAANSQITIKSNASITATGDVSIFASALSDVTLDTPNMFLGGAYAESNAIAKTIVETGASISAGGDVALSSSVSNTLDLNVRVKSSGLIGTAGKFLKIPGVQLSFAYGKGVSDSQTVVNDGAIINGNDVNVSSLTDNDFKVATKSQAKNQGNVGLALGVAISDMESNSNAQVFGDVTARGDVAVNAEATNEFNQIEANGVVKQLKLPFQDRAQQQIKQQLEGQLEKVKQKLQALKPGLGQNIGSSGEQKVTVDVGAGIAIANSTNHANAEIGDGARVQSAGKLDVTANAEDNFKAIAIGGAKMGSDVSIGGAVSVADYSNTANAHIGNAVVDVAHALTVKADATVPNQIEIDDDLKDIQNLSFGAPPDLSFSNLDEAAEVYEDVDNYAIETGQSLDKLSNIEDYLNTNLGVANKIATTFVAASAEAGGDNGNGKQLAVSGSVNLLTVNNAADAWIGQGAQINQTTALAAADQTVTVDAATTIETINVGGIPSVKNVIAPETKSTGSSVGGTYSGITYNNSTKAHIDSGANVAAAQDITVNADATNFTVNVNKSGSEAHQFGFAGAAGVNNFKNETLAYIQDGATVRAGTDLTVDANTDVFDLNIIGTTMKAQNVGVGASVSVNELENTTKAFIGTQNENAVSAGGTVTAGNDVTVDATSTEKFLNVAIAGTLATGSTTTTPGVPTDNPDDPLDGESLPNLFGEEPAQNVQKKAGIGISGDVAINILQDTTEAYIRGVAVNAPGDVTVKADNDAFTLAVSGAAALELSSESSGAAIAGSFTLNDLDRDVKAFTQNATINAGNVDVTANTDDTILSITAGGAGTKSGSAAVAGSANVNLIDSTTEAGLLGNTVVNATGDVTSDAQNFLLSVSVAGSIAAGGKVAVGAGADVGVNNTTVKSTIASSAQVNAGGDITVNATSEEDIISVGASAAVTDQKLGVSGSGAVQKLTTNVEASIGAGATVTTNQNLVVNATDDTFAVVVGGAAGGGKTAGVGAAVGMSDIDRTVKAFIDTDATVTAKGNGAAVSTVDGAVTGNGILINADANDELYLFGAGGAGGNKVAIAASVVNNSLTSEVDAYIGQGAVINANNGDAAAVQSVQIRANHDTDILSVAGSAAGSGKVGIGAAVDNETIKKTVKAHIDASAQVNAQNNIEVEATADNDMLNIAVGVTGSGAVGIAGSATVLTLTNTTEAYIDDNAQAIAQGNVVVAADNYDDLDTIAGAVAITGGAGFGVSNSTIVKKDTTKAYVDAGATVIAQGLRGAIAVPTEQRDNQGNVITQDMVGVSVTATSGEDLRTIAAGAGVAGGQGIAGSATVNVLDETTDAYIGNGAQVTANGAIAGESNGVNVLAADDTTILSIAGAAGFGGNGGGGAGADVGVIKKDTQAYVDASATVNTTNNVKVQALSDEDITSISGAVSAGGSAGIAGSAGVYTMNPTTKAFVGNQAVVNADGSVVVAADDASEVDLVSGNGSFGGGIGFGAAAGVVTATKTTDAHIGNNATINAKGLRPGITARTGQLTPSYVANQAADGEIAAPLSGNNQSDSQALTQQRVAQAQTQLIQGVAVTATNRDDIEAIAVSGNISANLSVTLAGSVNVITNKTSASIGSGARVNANTTDAGTGQSVIVGAANDYYHLGVAGSGSGGLTAGVGPGADTSVIKNTTKASIGSGAEVHAANDIQVTANGSEEILSISAGLGVGGTVGIAGAVSVVTINNETTADIGANAIAKAGNNVLVSANDDTETDIIAGSLGLGITAAGVGGSVGVTVINKKTDATIGQGAIVEGKANALNDTMTVFADEANGSYMTETSQGVAVQAHSREDVFTAAASGAGGFFAGVAGAVSVVSLDSDTNAVIAANARINQEAGGSATQSVNVSAANDAKVIGAGGSLAVSLGAGLAGGVDVGILKNDTAARIDSGAQVNAQKDVDVNALSIKDVDSFAASIGGGLVGVAGSVSVYSIGSTVSNQAKESLDVKGKDTTQDPKITSANTYVDDQASAKGITSLLGGYSKGGGDGKSDNNKRVGENMEIANTTVIANTSDESTSDESTSDESKPDKLTPKKLVTNSINDPNTSGTKAVIGSGAVVTAGQDVSVQAKEDITLDVTVGGAAAGVVSAGGAVAVATIGGNTKAEIATGATVSAGDDIIVNADQSNTSNGTALAGSAGLVGLGAQVVILEDNSVQEAFVANGATISRAADLNADIQHGLSIHANSTRSLTANSTGVVGGGLAAGASIARTTLSGSTTAFIGNTVAIGQDPEQIVSDVEIQANANLTTKSNAYAVAAGIGAGAGNDAKATIGTTIDAHIGNGSQVKAANDISVGAIATTRAETEARGIAAGGLAVGVSLSEATVNPTVNATIGTNAAIQAGRDLTVQASHTNEATKAIGNASSGGALVGNGVDAKATLKPAIKALVNTGTTLNAGRNVTINANSRNVAEANADGNAFGVIGVGVTLAKAEASGTTEAYLDGSVTQATNLIVTSQALNFANASSETAGGGLISGRFSQADAIIGTPKDSPRPTSGVRIGNNATVNVTNNVDVIATSSTDADAKAQGVGGGLGSVGASRASVDMKPQVNALIGQNATILAGGDVTVNARQGENSPPSDGSFNRTSVDNQADTINLGRHGLNTGDQVEYNNGSGSNIGGLVNERNYNILKVNDNAVQLGNVVDPSKINAADDTITFATPHNFETGDRVIYNSNGNANIGNLQDGRTYFVRKIDETTIKLAEDLATAQGDRLKSFSPATLNNDTDTIRLGQHGFTTGQAVTYRAPSGDGFKGSQVNSDSDIIDVGRDHGYATGQAVVYSELGNGRVGGLLDDVVYFVIRVSDTQFKLAATRDDAIAKDPKAINLTAPSGDSLHVIRPAAVNGLEDGRTYYVVRTDEDTFKLAANRADAIAEQPRTLNLNATGIGGAHLIGVEGVDLSGTSTTGTHSLSIDLDASFASDTTHRLIGAGGALSLISAPPGDGIATALATGSSGSVVDANAANANISDSVSVATLINNSAAIAAGRNVNIQSTSFTGATSTATNLQGGLVTAGTANSGIGLSNTNQLKTGNNVSITAGEDVTFLAQSNQIANSSTIAKGFAGISVVRTSVGSNVNYNTLTEIGDGTRITANDTLALNAQTGTSVEARANLDGRGLGSDSESNAVVQIGQTQASNRVNIGRNADLTAATLDVNANVTNTRANASADTQTSAAGADADASATVNTNTSNDVLVKTGAELSATQGVNLNAQQNGYATEARTRSDLKLASFKIFGREIRLPSIGGDTDAESRNTLISQSQVTTEDGSKIKTGTLNVTADTNVVKADSNADRRGAIFDGGSEVRDRILRSDRTIDFNSTLSAEPDPELVIDENGNVVRAYNASIQDTDSQTLGPVQADDIVVNDLRNDTPMQATFRIPFRFLFGNSGRDALRGNPKFQESYDSVKITNLSNKDVVINDIDAINETSPAITVDGLPSKGGAFAGDLGNLPHVLSQTLVDIQNQSESDVVLTGEINNPHARTQIVNAGGDILSSGAQAVIKARDLELISTQGGIGTESDRVRAELVQGFGEDKLPQKPLDQFLTANADKSVYMDLQGVRHDADPITVTVKQMVSETEDVNLRLRQAVDQNNNSIDQDGNPISSTYQFKELRAGGNIIIDATNSNTNVIGNIDIVNDGKLDVVTGGNVELTESTGKLDVKRVISSNGDIQLTVKDAPNAGQDLILNSDSVVSAANAVTLLVGDDVEMAMGATLTAGTTATVQGDVGNADSGTGSEVTLRGAVNTPQLVVTGGSDADTVSLREATGYVESTVNLESGNDIFDGGAGRDAVTAGTGDDAVNGNGGDDALNGGDGKDSIQGGAGNDQIDAGAGDDSVRGGTGDDQIDGGEGKDNLSGEAGRDRIDGGDGDDAIQGGDNNDTVFGGDGKDAIDGGAGDDDMRGGSGADLMKGGTGSDTMTGDAGNDDLEGGEGNDIMNGGSGDDSLVGDSGNDELQGDAGDDYLEGGTGGDIFKSVTDDDIVADFDDGPDSIS
jgi:hypothetical protein